MSPLVASLFGVKGTGPQGLFTLMCLPEGDSRDVVVVGEVKGSLYSLLS